MAIRGRERTAWQDIYAIQQTSSMMHVGRYSELAADGDIGILGDGSTINLGYFLMKLTDHPHLQPANQSLEQELAVGISQRREDEFNQVASELAAVTLNMQMHAWNLSLFTRGLFQDGSREAAPAGTLINQINMPYWIPDVTDFMACTRVLDQKGPTNGKYPHETYVNPLGNALGAAADDADFTSHFMTGMIPRSIAITAEEGNIIQMAVDCAGAYAGITNVAGKMDARWHTTRRLRVYPTPTQIGGTGELAAGSTNEAALIQVWVGGVPIINTNLKISREEFNATVPADTVEIAVDTGEMNFSDAQATAGHGRYVTHNAYRNHSTDFNYRHPFELLPDLKAPLLWQNAQVKMRRMDLYGSHNDAANSWIDVKLPGFTLTMNNNVVGHFYNNPVPYKYLLGRFTTEGTVTVPWGTDKASITPVRPSFGGNNPLVDFLDGVGSRLRVMWGQNNHLVDASGAATGYTDNGYHFVTPERDGAVAIDLAIRHTDESVEGENELGQAMTFTTVDDLGAQLNLQPDKDKTTALRITIGYLNTVLDRGQDLPLEYPESSAP